MWWSCNAFPKHRKTVPFLYFIVSQQQLPDIFVYWPICSVGIESKTALEKQKKIKKRFVPTSSCGQLRHVQPASASRTTWTSYRPRNKQFLSWTWKFAAIHTSQLCIPTVPQSHNTYLAPITFPLLPAETVQHQNEMFHHSYLRAVHTAHKKTGEKVLQVEQTALQHSFHIHVYWGKWERYFTRADHIPVNKLEKHRVSSLAVFANADLVQLHIICTIAS